MSPVAQTMEEAKQRADDLKKLRTTQREEAELLGDERITEDEYFAAIKEISLNGLVFPLRRVVSVGGVQKIKTLHGETDANGGDFVIGFGSLGDSSVGGEVVVSFEIGRALDKASGVVHYDDEGNIIDPPKDYPSAPPTARKTETRMHGPERGPGGLDVPRLSVDPRGESKLNPNPPPISPSKPTTKSDR